MKMFFPYTRKSIALIIYTQYANSKYCDSSMCKTGKGHVIPVEVCGSVGHPSAATTGVNTSAEVPAVALCLTCRKGKCSKCLSYIGTKYRKSKQTSPPPFGASASLHLLVTAITARESAKQSSLCFASRHFGSSEAAECFLLY